MCAFYVTVTLALGEWIQVDTFQGVAGQPSYCMHVHWHVFLYTHVRIPQTHRHTKDINRHSHTFLSFMFCLSGNLTGTTDKSSLKSSLKSSHFYHVYH